MALRRGSKRSARGEPQPGLANEVGPAAQAGQALQDAEDLYQLDREWHKHWERVLLPRRCAFLMPVPKRLMSFMIEAGFGYAIQLQDFVFDAAHISTFVEHWRPESRRHTLSTSREVSAPSLCRMWRITWVSAWTGILLVVACGIFRLIISSNPPRLRLQHKLCTLRAFATILAVTNKVFIGVLLRIRIHLHRHLWCSNVNGRARYHTDGTSG
ncbi:hypothetical protein PIB30_004697 [Stylosanthes scabra]|uniref:Uncharacterized protein n=1 Tax=Stylosanthes scabra TaxID=79078 RepID=A0ABU6R4W8_9FABA|nr:hypothetical protein [Stylosanthes scabra]